MKTLNQLFNDLGLIIADEETTLDWSRQRSSLGSQMSVTRLGAHKPYWSVNSTIYHQKKKKIFFNSWRALSPELNKFEFQVVSLLRDHGFQCYIKNRFHQLEEMNHPNSYLWWRNQIIVPFTENPEEFLLDQGVEPRDYFILDDIAVDEFCKEAGRSVDENTLEFHSLNLNKYISDQIISISQHRNWKNIKCVFICKDHEHIQKLLLTWSGFPFQALPQLLNNIEKGDVLLEDWHSQYITEIASEYTISNFLDVSRMTSLKNLKVSIDSLQHLIGANDCPLERIDIKVYEDNVDEDFELVLPKLPVFSSVKELTITFDHEQSVEVSILLILTKFPNLESLTINNFIPTEGKLIDLSNASSLTKVCLTQPEDIEVKLIGNKYIKHLECDFNPMLIDLNTFPQLSHLAIKCRDINNFITLQPSIMQLEALESLKLMFLKDDGKNLLLNLNSLVKLKHLHVDFRRFEYLQELEINECVNLITLCVYGFKKINVGSLRNLEKLITHRYDVSIEGLENCKNLKECILPENQSHLWPRKEICLYDQEYEICHENINNYIIIPYIESCDDLKVNFKTNRSDDIGHYTTYLKPLFESPLVDIGSYRIRLFDTLRSIKEKDKVKEIVFDSSPIDPAHLIEIDLPGLPSEVSNDLYQGCMPVNMAAQSYMCLVGLSADDRLLEVKNAEQFIIYKDTRNHQYVVKLNPDCKEKVRYIEYTLQSPMPCLSDKAQANRFNFKQLKPAISASLPEEIKSALDAYKQKREDILAPLTILLDHVQEALEEDKISRAIYLLANYCEKFAEQAESEDEESKDVIEELMAMIKNQDGGCFPRSVAFFILAKYFGIDAKYVDNDVHAYVAVTAIELVNGEQIEREICLNLSGDGDFEKKIYRDCFEEASYYANAKINPLLKQRESRYRQVFNPQPSWVSQCQTVDVLLPHLLNDEKASLIRVRHENQALTWYQALSASLQARTDLPFVYLSSKEDIASLFTLTTLKDNQFIDIPGPLKTLITNGRGVIFIDWSGFNKRELAIYKCMMDKPGNLNGLTFSDELKVIGIMPASMRPNDVFLSRCRSITPAFQPNDAPHENQKKVRGVNTAFDWEVNLYNDTNWEKYLIEDIKINDRFEMIPGILIEAMQQGKKLVIYNPPATKSFEQFWRRFNIEKKVLFNGEYITSQPGFAVTLDIKSLDKNQLPNNVHFYTHYYITNKERAYYLNRESYSHLFDSQIIDDNLQCFYTHTGLLNKEHDQQLLLTEELTDGQWQHILDVAAESGYPVHFYIPAHLTTPFTGPAKSKAQYNSWFIYDLNQCDWTHKGMRSIVTPDVLFMMRKIKHDLHMSSENIFYVCPKQGLASLIEDVEINDADGRLQIRREDNLFWSKLQAGETVILCGNIKPNDLRALESLFKMPAYLMVNGSKVFVEGHLIWIAQEAPAELYPLQYAPTMADYHVLAEQEERAAMLSSDVIDMEVVGLDKRMELLNAMYLLAELLQKLETYSLPITYEKYKMLKEALMATSLMLWKGQLLHHYHKETALYRALKQRLAIFSVPAEKPVGYNSHKKQQQLIAQVLQEGNTPLIYLVGDANTGKTHAAKAAVRALQANLYQGEGAILPWLRSKVSEDKLNILLLSRIHLAALGQLEYFRGSTESPPVIYYEGKKYPLSPSHKVIFTGYPSEQTETPLQMVLWEKAHTIRFYPLKPDFIHYKVKKYLETAVATSHRVEASAAIMVAIYEHLRDYRQRYANFSFGLRDIKNICLRAKHLAETQVMGIDAAIKQAIYDEVAALLVPAGKKELLVKLGIPGSLPLPYYETLPKDTDLIIPNEKENTWRILLDDLSLRAQRIKGDCNRLGKLGLLLEGPSGIGKTQFIITALEYAGLSKDASDTQQRYVQITAGTAAVATLLLQAFHEGSAVVLDELNLDPSIQVMLKSLLDGEDPVTCQPARKAGFTVYASQNPSYYDGCDATALEVLSGLHKVDMNDYSNEELQYIAGQAGHPEPEEFVYSYQEARRVYAGVNTRTFFHAIADVKKAGTKKESSICMESENISSSQGIKRKRLARHS